MEPHEALGWWESGHCCWVASPWESSGSALESTALPPPLRYRFDLVHWRQMIFMPAITHATPEGAG